MSREDVSSTLSEELERLAAERKAQAIAVAVHDLETDFRFSFRATAGFTLQAQSRWQCFLHCFARQTRAGFS